MTAYQHCMMRILKNGLKGRCSNILHLCRVFLHVQPLSKRSLSHISVSEQYAHEGWEYQGSKYPRPCLVPVNLPRGSVNPIRLARHPPSPSPLPSFLTPPTSRGLACRWGEHWRLILIAYPIPQPYRYRLCLRARPLGFHALNPGSPRPGKLVPSTLTF